uniref:Uncharacterized protein n=1 Tax=Aegilops tauschii subsp. strangulata TaxID=200361 RepID=A0A453S1H0_AEGTS
FRLMALSKKLTSIDQNISCDHAFLMKVSSSDLQMYFSFLPLCCPLLFSNKCE